MTVGDQHVTRMTHHAGAAGVGHVQDVHRHVGYHFLRHVNQHALTGKRGVERGEAIAVGRRRHAEVTRQQLGFLHRSGGEIHHPHAIGQRADRRQRRRIAAIQEYHQRPRATERVRRERRGVERAHGTVLRGHERCVRDRRHARVLPVLAARGREAQARERVGAGGAQCGERGRGAVGRRGGERAGLRLKGQCGAHRGGHGSAHAASNTQSYPRASSSSASDLSPDFTMRPPASTCT